MLGRLQFFTLYFEVHLFACLGSFFAIYGQIMDRILVLKNAKLSTYLFSHNQKERKNQINSRELVHYILKKQIILTIFQKSRQFLCLRNCHKFSDSYHHHDRFLLQLNMNELHYLYIFYT